MTESESVIRTTLNYIKKEYSSGAIFCQGQSMDKLVHEVQAVMRQDYQEIATDTTPISEDVAPAESETTHYTSGGVDEDKDTKGFGGFANGAP